MVEQNDISISQWLDSLLAKGAYGFSKAALQRENPEYSDIAVKRALNRLSTKGKILSLYKGYYLFIPPQYASKGILPVSLYLDAFMTHLQRPYYIALLNAAAFHGASHQQPQEYFVITNFPVLRPTKKKGIKINYISIKEIPQLLIEKRKTEAGYLAISNAALTACDLIQFEKRVGGLNRAATVLNELAEVIKPNDFNPILLKHVHVTALQRLGYLLESVCSNFTLADALFESIEKENLSLFRIPLKAAKATKGYSSENRWKVIVNTEIEIDE
ncbi:type IV toxin-antitoxin system AbiEi family antitoxin domain-containing protein [Xanthocytophaga flava]|uniref:type IV toxin-antitoxin system AbiEi family antitoxin domain-containing protein n=1 Tax=Xanthocytophaga flava TaxID=3048013 RepID=UPI0028D573BB|nr:type IV toxin-antitoxin system AbiEi family antitoxin [Xanthocytophaga flavus]MDJ1466192.1 type IV toxin-antitoxin system AbiEi family antitoxin [Xanthocytophaga flavus]